MKKTDTCPVILIAILMFNLSMNGRAQEAVKETEQMPIIIFVCDHGAAKSIVSAAYFNKLAGERRLNFRAIARGTNPDKEISPKVQDGLQNDGLTSSELVPKKISKADLAGARGSSTFNRGHLHHLAILALRAFVGRPRGIVGFHLRGGTLNERSSSTVQQ